MDTACEIFENIVTRDPFSVELMDSYSNILYVREERTALSRLAHACHTANKYRPETCCVIGNYYSLRQEHQKALIYLRRALQMDPSLRPLQFLDS